MGEEHIMYVTSVYYQSCQYKLFMESYHFTGQAVKHTCLHVSAIHEKSFLLPSARESEIIIVTDISIDGLSANDL